MGPLNSRFGVAPFGQTPGNNTLNTGVLEQYLEEKNLQDSFEISHWDTRKVLIGIFIGAVFSGVTASGAASRLYGE